ncbi:MAG TPA: DUF4255 domain-containing protein [Pyrinomonadaceae bacterium]|nr:DUF4255 domain-containing protein [Pyrinomonadaceae bacterium]
MSNSLAIAAVTTTLRKLIDDQIRREPAPQDTGVTTQPPDKVPDKPGNLVNLFLYQTSLNGAWRNADMPGQVRSGETGQTPLALNLHYVLTAYSKDDDKPEPVSHQLLGRAMSILHDHPVLSAADIRDALPAAERDDFDLYDQIERVRITPQPLTLDEMSKLWTIFQVKYRVSAAYQVAVVLIESRRPAKTPLPVTRRGQQDEGVTAQGNLTSPFPTLTKLAFPNERQPSIELGQALTLTGHHLDGNRLRAHFSNPRLDEDIVVPALADPALPTPTSIESADIALALPDTPAARAEWVAGFYTVTVVVERDADLVNKTRETNALVFALAPRILTRLPATRSAAAGDFTLTITCSPEVRPNQRAAILFGDREILADAHATQTDTLTFSVKNISAESVGKHYLRLRVDGVDSMIVDYAQTPPVFNENLMVEITP